MRAEDREDLDRYATGELPPGRLEAIEKLLLQDGEARRYLVQLTQPASPAKSMRPRLRKRVRRSSTKGRLLEASRLLIPASVVVAGCMFAVAANQFLPTSRKTTVLKIGVAASAPRDPVFHPPVPSRDVFLHDWANAIPREPRYAATALLLRAKRLGTRPAVEEILALELANAGTDLSNQLEPLVLLHKQPPGGGSRVEGQERVADSSRRSERGSK